MEFRGPKANSTSVASSQCRASGMLLYLNVGVGVAFNNVSFIPNFVTVVDGEKELKGEGDKHMHV